MIPTARLLLNFSRQLIRTGITAGLLIVMTLAATAQNQQLETARTALSTNDADATITALDSLSNSGATSPTLYQALGNAHYDRGEYGRAILAYERGLRLQPGNDELANNLKFVRGEAGIDRPILKEFFLVRWWRGLGAALGVGVAKWIALFCWILAVTGAVFWYLRKETMAETRRFALLPISGFLLALAFVFYLLGNSRQAYLGNDRDGVLITQQTELRVAPGPEATLEEQLSEGLKVRVLDEFESYLKISLENGRQGWVESEAVARI